MCNKIMNFSELLLLQLLPNTHTLTCLQKPTRPLIPDYQWFSNNDIGSLITPSLLHFLELWCMQRCTNGRGAWCRANVSSDILGEPRPPAGLLTICPTLMKFHCRHALWEGTMSPAQLKRWKRRGRDRTKKATWQFPLSQPLKNLREPLAAL